jgi:hypothetical protein
VRESGFIQVDVEGVAIEEEDGAKSLVLGRGGDILFGGQEGEELPDLIGSHFARMALVVKEDEVLDPGDVGIFGAGRVVFDPQGVAVDVEQFAARRRAIGYEECRKGSFGGVR